MIQKNCQKWLVWKSKFEEKNHPEHNHLEIWKKNTRAQTFRYIRFKSRNNNFFQPH